ncbi:MAG: AAA family ATPase [Gammaproteobacteria bacterium]|nr:AAA family ATPase [Gammaproteobacteria bacterium]
MKLLRLKATNYRCLRDVSIELEDFNLFIGANASGKSTILDALRFLHEGVHARDFEAPLYARGGFLNLAWKGEDAHQIDLAVTVQDGQEATEWSIRITRQGHYFHVGERVAQIPSRSPPVVLLEADGGTGWWWSNTTSERVEMQQPATVCALAAAAADASFPAREIADFVRRWGFFDPNPFLLRRDWSGLDSSRLDHYGRNLGETLHALASSAPEVVDRIRSATQNIVGLPAGIETRESEDRFYFVQSEPGLRFTVHQMGVSSGTLRTLALMTALLGEPETNLLGIEEPENYIHPSALSAFVEYLRESQDRVQFMVTTHSPLLLDLLDDPSSVCVVQRSDRVGTTAHREANPDGVRNALNASGFSLGEFYQTKGFGAP